MTSDRCNGLEGSRGGNQTPSSTNANATNTNVVPANAANPPAPNTTPAKAEPTAAASEVAALNSPTLSPRAVGASRTDSELAPTASSGQTN